MSAGQMPSNSQCVLQYHRNVSLIFLGGKCEQFGEQGDAGPLCMVVGDRRSRLGSEECQSGSENI